MDKNEIKIRPKIAIIVDVEGWAYHNNALEIQKRLNKYYDIDIIPVTIFGDNIVKIFIIGLKYDLMFFMWRANISWLYSDFSKKYIEEIGYTFNEFIKKFVKDRNIVTGVYDHLFLNEEKERTKFILENVKDYIVSSNKLKNIYNDSYQKKPSFVITDGVDLNLFKMKNKDKYLKVKENKEMKIGWTGNSKFTDESGDDLKGLQKVIKPAIQELQDEGYKIKLEIADRNIKLIPHSEMPKYYENIDIYICASRTEGTPDTVLEAMACGIPIISTDVGIVTDVFGEKQSKYIIKRNKDDLKEKIKKLINNPKELNELSKENLERIKKYSWDCQSEKFKKFIEKNLKKGEENEKKQR